MSFGGGAGGSLSIRTVGVVYFRFVALCCSFSARCARQLLQLQSSPFCFCFLFLFLCFVRVIFVRFFLRDFLSFHADRSLYSSCSDYSHVHIRVTTHIPMANGGWGLLLLILAYIYYIICISCFACTRCFVVRRTCAPYSLAIAKNCSHVPPAAASIFLVYDSAARDDCMR